MTVTVTGPDSRGPAFLTCAAMLIESPVRTSAELTATFSMTMFGGGPYRRKV